MIADTFLKIGTSHDICQDYVIKTPDNQNVILSDGCSSCKDTDIGSRLLVKAAEDVLLNCGSLGHEAVKSAEVYARTIKLDTDSLCATLLTAKTLNECINISIFGDGVIAARSITGKITILNYEFDSNAPYYLRYDLDKDKKREYFDNFSNKGKCSFFTINPDGSYGEHGIREWNWTFSEERTSFYLFFQLLNYDLVAIFSDGVSSFINKNGQKSDLKDIVKEFMSFKNYGGDFVKRRCKKAFKYFDSLGLHNYDDFSMAVLYNNG